MSESIASILQDLTAAAGTPLDRNDLGRLAHMHTLAQAMLGAMREGSAGCGGAPFTALMRQLITLLERIILDEAADAAAGLALIPEVITKIGELHAGAGADCASLLRATALAAGIDAPEVAEVTDDVAPSDSPQAAEARREPDVADVELADPQAAPTPSEGYVAEPLILDMQEREHIEGFLDESVEHLDAIEAGLLDLESDASDAAKINELFRPFHTIKGIAGFLNLRDINRLTHEIETILDLGRKGELTIAQPTIDLIFAGVDVLKAQLRAIRTHMATATGGPCPQPEIADLMSRLRAATRPDGAIAPAKAPPACARAESPAATGNGPTALPPPEPAVLDNSIRVDTRKLDMLVDAVGELVIAQSMVGLQEAQVGNERLHRNVAQVTKIVRDVHETAMAMRMVPIGQTFQKMRRLVRDVARKAGKSVELHIHGEETELDKTVIQQISDPLVHMVRNAIDHGIEPPGDRIAAEKPEVGRVMLDAYHQGDSIVIEVRDDGRGLDARKLVAKAVERGLIAPEDELSESQVFGLILHAGFSTAEKVTDISGRGVGMDVVKRNIERLRGKIEIESVLGRGSTFRISLPLTLAIIDGMLVRVGRERMIIPTILIEQSLRPEAKDVHTVQRRGAVLRVRGELIPLIQLGALFHGTRPINPCEHLAVVVQCGAQKTALVVDELIGQQQVVIKTLGERFKGVRGISGAAILGDGRVGMILEPGGILALHNERRDVRAWEDGPAGEEVCERVAARAGSAATDDIGTDDGGVRGAAPTSRTYRPQDLIPA